MKYTCVVSLALLLLLPLPVLSQMNAPAVCPVEFLRLDPSAVSLRVRNISGKTIVGLSFYAALADATEHWKWVHWDFDDARPLREFGWNKPIKAQAAKNLSWDRGGLDFEHGGGGALVLTSVLFEDGTSWEESPDGSSCRAAWYNNHKKTFTRPIDLPARK
jgi:hypothetical protein